MRRLQKLKMPSRKRHDLSSLDESTPDQSADRRVGEEPQSPDPTDSTAEGYPSDDKSDAEDLANGDQNTDQSDSGEMELGGDPASKQMEEEGKRSPESGPLAHIDDEQLLDEVRKRGLSGKQEDNTGDEYLPPYEDGQDGGSKF